MTSKDFKTIARLLKQVYQELEKQALDEGVDLMSPEYDELINRARLRVLENAGFTIEEYRSAKEANSTFTQDAVNKNLSLMEETSKSLEHIKNTHIPTIDEIKDIARSIAKEYIKPPQITNQIVKEITKEVKIEQPKIIETIKVTRETYDAKPIEKKLSKLEEKIDNIKIPEIPKPLDINELKTELKSEWNKDLKENINTLGMPDFRKLAMGLRADIDRIDNEPSGGGGTWGTITGNLSDQTDLQSVLDGKEPAKGADDNYVTDAQLVVIGNTSGTNTGDQNLTNYFLKTADDTDDITVGATNKFATAAEKTKLGFITVTQAVDLDTIESDTATNNAKVTNATHTGDATGDTALTVVKIQGISIPAPTAGDDQKVIKYNHGTTAFIYDTVSGGSGLSQSQVMARLSIGF